jgi:hypothetical protein
MTLAYRLGAASALALLAALPAAAQTGLCGGPGDNGQWIGGAEATSDVSTAGAAMEQMALVLMRNEYVALFTVSAGTDVRMEAQGRGTGDPVIDLRNAAGEIILSDDDSGGGGASRAETFLDPGTYCLSLKSYDGSPMTGFVRIGRLEHEALTPGMALPDGIDDTDIPFMGDTMCSVDMITNYIGDGPVDESLQIGGAFATASVNDVPLWGFTLSAPTAVSITAQNESADPLIALYDEFGNYLAENDDTDGLNSRIDMTYPLSAGTYCVAVSALSDTMAPITVGITAYDPNLALIGMYERAEASPPLDGSYPITALGQVNGRLRTDIQSTSVASWFSVDVPTAGLLLIEAVTNNMGDPTLTLFDDFGRQISFNDDSNSTLDSMIAARVQPGTYIVAVRQLNGTTPILTRLLFERYIAAQ